MAGDSAGDSADDEVRGGSAPSSAGGGNPQLRSQVSDQARQEELAGRPNMTFS